jgi:hypothetical protein
MQEDGARGEWPTTPRLPRRQSAATGGTASACRVGRRRKKPLAHQVSNRAVAGMRRDADCRGIGIG